MSSLCMLFMFFRERKQVCNGGEKNGLNTFWLKVIIYSLKNLYISRFLMLAIDTSKQRKIPHIKMLLFNINYDLQL